MMMMMMMMMMMVLMMVLMMMMMMVLMMMMMMTYQSFDPFQPPFPPLHTSLCPISRRARRAVVACGINLCHFHSSSASGAEAVLPIEEKLGYWRYPVPLHHPGEHRSLPTVCMQVIPGVGI